MSDERTIATAPDTGELDQLMEQASQSLADMDYLSCEEQCLAALAAARSQGDWAYYARILLPLQEARRQRRMIAAEGVIWLGTVGQEADPLRWLSHVPAGCIAVTHPHLPEDAADLAATAKQQRQYVEVLYVDSEAKDDRWTLRSFAGPEAVCELPAPHGGWRNRWIKPGEAATLATQAGGRGPADWFLDAAEALGDAALAKAEADQPPALALTFLEQCLDVVTDHEIIHQRLGEAARQLCLQ